MRTLRAVSYLLFVLLIALSLHSQEKPASAAAYESATLSGPRIQVYNPGPDVTPPMLTKSDSPSQPPGDANPELKHIGTVGLTVEVGNDGSIYAISINKSLEPDLDLQAIAAVRTAQFVPGIKAGDPVRTRIFIDVNFSELRSQVIMDPLVPGLLSPMVVDGLGLVYRVGNGVSPPTLIKSPDPEYSKEARKAKHEGTSVLWLIVDATGRPQNVRIKRPTGYGLDEKAVKAVRKWKFKPALKNDLPVAVQINVEVNFQLY